MYTYTQTYTYIYIGHVLHKYKYILELDKELAQVIKPSNIFASFRKSKTIQDLLVHSKLPQVEESERTEGIKGCKPCAKGCVLCKYYLKETSTVTSFHTNREFRIESELDCQVEGVIYLINDLVCKISYIGCTTLTSHGRFANHKSHIKKWRCTCEVSKHFKNYEHKHELNRNSTNKNYDESLGKQIDYIIVEKVDFKGTTDPGERVKLCQRREGYWQNQLKTLNIYGGMNIRDEQRYQYNRDTSDAAL